MNEYVVEEYADDSPADPLPAEIEDEIAVWFEKLSMLALWAIHGELDQSKVESLLEQADEIKRVAAQGVDSRAALR